VSVGLAVLRVVRLFDVVRHITTALECVGEGAHGSSKFLSLFYFFLLSVAKFMELPEGSEAHLVAKESGLEIQFDTGRALHLARLSAVRGGTGTFNRRFRELSRFFYHF
jgi:hypothetical protein